MVVKCGVGSRAIENSTEALAAGCGTATVVRCGVGVKAIENSKDSPCAVAVDAKPGFIVCAIDAIREMSLGDSPTRKAVGCDSSPFLVCVGASDSGTDMYGVGNG